MNLLQECHHEEAASNKLWLKYRASASQMNHAIVANPHKQSIEKSLLSRTIVPLHLKVVSMNTSLK